MSQPQPLSFHPWFLWVIDDKLQAEEKHPKTLLFRSCKGCPHKSYKNATGQTRCSQRVIRFEPPWKKVPFFPTKTWQTEPWSQGFHPLGTESYPQSLVLAFLAGWFACWGSVCQNIGTEKSQHGHPFQPLEILKITRTGLGVSTPIPKFSSLILVGYWWQTLGWRKTSKNPLVLKLKGVPSQKLQRCNRLSRM